MFLKKVTMLTTAAKNVHFVLKLQNNISSTLLT